VYLRVKVESRKRMNEEKKKEVVMRWRLFPVIFFRKNEKGTSK